MRFVVAPTQTTAKHWTRRIVRSRANCGTELNWTKPGLPLSMKDAGDCCRLTGARTSCPHERAARKISTNKGSRVLLETHVMWHSNSFALRAHADRMSALRRS